MPDSFAQNFGMEPIPVWLRRLTNTLRADKWVLGSADQTAAILLKALLSVLASVGRKLSSAKI